MISSLLAVIPEYQGGRGRTVDTPRHRAPEVDGLPDGFVLGHHLYPRHGFRPCAETVLSAPYPIPEEQPADDEALTAQPNVTGHIQCAQALMKPETGVNNNLVVPFNVTQNRN